MRSCVWAQSQKELFWHYVFVFSPGVRDKVWQPLKCLHVMSYGQKQTTLTDWPQDPYRKSFLSQTISKELSSKSIEGAAVCIWPLSVAKLSTSSITQQTEGGIRELGKEVVLRNSQKWHRSQSKVYRATLSSPNAQLPQYPGRLSWSTFCTVPAHGMGQLNNTKKVLKSAYNCLQKYFEAC